jgi:hypothetical protein
VVLSIIPALGKLRQNCKFKASLGYIVRPYLKNKTNKINMDGDDIMRRVGLSVFTLQIPQVYQKGIKHPSMGTDHSGQEAIALCFASVANNTADYFCSCIMQGNFVKQKELCAFQLHSNQKKTRVPVKIYLVRTNRSEYVYVQTHAYTEILIHLLCTFSF